MANWVGEHDAEKREEQDLENLRILESRVSEMYNQRQKAQSKYTYFLLAASGAAIAFAMQKTDASQIEWSQIPLLAAVSFRGFSFYFGCQRIHVLVHAMLVVR